MDGRNKEQVSLDAGVVGVFGGVAVIVLPVSVMVNFKTLSFIYAGAAPKNHKCSIFFLSQISLFVISSGCIEYVAKIKDK